MYDPWFDAHPAMAAEKTADDYGITREDQDNFACESYRRSKEAIKNGIFKREIEPLTTVDGDTINQDEEPNKFNKKKMLAMKAAFKTDGICVLRPYFFRFIDAFLFFKDYFWQIVLFDA